MERISNQEYLELRSRLKDLNTKAYYLLVALSFVFGRSPAPALKWAFVLTAYVAVAPVQDYVERKSILETIRVSKILALWAAFACTVYWVWCVS